MKSRINLPPGFDAEQPEIWAAIRNIETLREVAAEQPDANTLSDDEVKAEIERLQEVSVNADWRIDGLRATMLLRFIARAMGGEQT